MDRNKLIRRITGREVIRRLEAVKSEYEVKRNLGTDYESQIAGAIDNLKFENTFVMAKLEQTGLIVRILSFSENVKFSEDGDGPLRLVYSSPSYDTPRGGAVLGIFVYEINKDYVPLD